MKTQHLCERPDRLLPKLAMIEILCRICQGRADVIADYRQLSPAALLFYEMRYGAGGPITLPVVLDDRVCDRCLDRDLESLDHTARIALRDQRRLDEESVRIWAGACVTSCGRIGLWRSDESPGAMACDCGGIITPQNFRDVRPGQGFIISGTNHRRVVQ